MCAEPGRLYSSRGSTQRQDMFVGGTIFADISSRYISVHHQVSLAASDTIHSKIKFEQEAFHSGVQITKYHTDNGVFKSHAFLEELAKHKQEINNSGSGTPHQNGFAERGIGIVQNMAHTMMIHAAMQQPAGTVTAALWPMAMDYACWLYNNIPQQDSGFTLLELWSRSTFQAT